MLATKNGSLSGEKMSDLMNVAILTHREDGGGNIKLYRVNSKDFNAELGRLYPTSEEDWGAMADWVDKHGKLLNTFVPDYTITVAQ